MCIRKIITAICILTASTLASAAIFTQKWALPAGGAIYSSPAIDAAGNLYFGARDNRVYAVDPNGNILWTTPAYGDWIDSSPVLLADGGLVVGSWDFKVYCFERATGALRWSYTTGGAVTASPAVGEAGRIAIASTDGTITVLEPQDGSVVWTYLSPNQGDIETSIAIDDEGNLYFADSVGTAISLTKTGNLRWAINLAEHSNTTGLTEFEVYGSPALSGEGDVYFGTRSQELFALDSLDGSVQWTHFFNAWVDSAPVLLSDGSILSVDRLGRLTCLSKAGFVLWTQNVGEVLYSSPVVDDQDRIYVAGYIGNNRTRLSCLDKDGNTVASTILTGINDSAPSIGRDGTLYLGMHTNHMIAFEGGGSPLSRTSIWPRFRQNLHQDGRYNGFDPIVMQYFPTAVSTDGGWYKLDWLGSGWLNATFFPWVYHIEHEWLLCSGEGNTENFWFYDQRLGWGYFSRNWGDIFFHSASQSLIFYLVETSLLNTQGRWFYDFGTGEWMQEQALYLKK